MKQQNHRSIGWPGFAVEDLNPIRFDEMVRGRVWHIRRVRHGSSLVDGFLQKHCARAPNCGQEKLAAVKFGSGRVRNPQSTCRLLHEPFSCISIATLPVLPLATSAYAAAILTASEPLRREQGFEPFLFHPLGRLAQDFSLTGPPDTGKQRV